MTSPEPPRTASLPRWQRALLAACAGVIGYMLGYVATDYADLPRLTYFPLDRSWRLSAKVTGLPMGYVGMWLWATAVGLLCCGAVFAGLRWRRRAVSGRALGLVLAWTVTAVVLAVAYFTWHNWP